MSIRALSEWWERRAKEENSERFIRAAKVANDIGTQAEKLPIITSALKSTLTQWAFDLALSGADPEKVKSIMSVVSGMDRAALDRSELELAERKVALLEKKAEQADAAARVTADAALTPEEKARKYREIFGLA